jgi:hypothetical protein
MTPSADSAFAVPMIYRQVPKLGGVG